MQATRKAKNAVNGIAFRPLQDADLPMLTAWLAEPHVRRFYQKQPVTLADVTREYGPTIRGEEPSRSHLAIATGRRSHIYNLTATWITPNGVRLSLIHI